MRKIIFWSAAGLSIGATIIAIFGWFIAPIIAPVWVVRSTPILTQALSTYAKNKSLCWGAMSQRMDRADDRTKTEVLLLLQSSDILVKNGAISATGMLKLESAVEPLSKIITTEPSNVLRFDAVRSLGLIKSKTGLAPILEATNDTDHEVREVAIRMASLYSHEVDKSIFLKGVTDPDPIVRKESVEALLIYELGDSIDIIVRLLDDPNSVVVDRTLRLLSGYLGRPEVRAAVEAKAVDPDEHVRKLAKDVLRKSAGN